MRDFSENMEVSPMRQAQVATCEKLRDTVTGISALHMSLHDGRSSSPQNSFKELYLTSTQAMIKRKEEMPKKGTALTDPIKKKNFVSKWTKEGISFANVVTGEILSQTPPENNKKKKEDSPREFLSQEDNTSDLAQVLELFNIISKLVQKNPKILDLLSKFKNSNSDEEKTCLLAEAIKNNI
ncbi:hypothetical protein TNCV_241461 [Trichonephila clavipes]|uniref:Uncharacterized protein n=1 Tax=Trichonephila clavipes TaxID=2585209 RepID=A0A8X7BDQ6_TRICX|nr:hypothetical protein TNCV_241461 [Trichonephila clavipes]